MQPVTLADAPQPGTPLVELMMEAGRRVQPDASLDQLRQRTATNLTRLSPALRRLETSAPYPVEISSAVRGLAQSIDESRD